MRIYEKYRDSGVEWIGEIPDYWTSKRLKHISSLITEKGQPTPEDVTISPENVVSGTGFVTNYHSDHGSEGVPFTTGDILFNKLRVYLNKIVNTTYSGFSLGELIVIRPTEVNGSFLYYSLGTSGFIDWCNSRSTGVKLPRTNSTDILGSKFPLPPLPEQQQIVTFLDHKTSLIDDLIQKKTKKIELLKEYRTSLINQVVTKGLDPDVEMKDSGVDWIGEIPVGWDPIRLKFISQLQTGLTLGKKYGDRSLVPRPYLRVANVLDGSFDLSMVTEVEIPIEDVDSYLLRVRDVLMTEGGDFDKLGRGHVWEGQIRPCLHQNHIFCVRVNQSRLDPYFLTYVMSSSVGKYYFMSTSSQTTNLASTNSTKVKGLPIPLPDLSEQQKIVTYLDERTSEIDDSIQNEEDKIQLLKEYRQSLISEVVTGKIDVRVE